MTHSLVEKNQQSEENKVSNRTETPSQYERRESVESLKHVWENETVLQPHRGLHGRKSTININQSLFMLIVDCWLWVCGSCLLEQGSDLLLCSPHLTLWLNQTPSGSLDLKHDCSPSHRSWGALSEEPWEDECIPLGWHPHHPQSSVSPIHWDASLTQ